MVVGVGVDVANVQAIERWHERYDDDVLSLVFTHAELLSRVSGNASTLAVCFAAKEAVAKALARSFGRFNWNEIDVAFDELALRITLQGSTKRLAATIGVERLIGSVALTPKWALVCIVAVRKGDHVRHE